ncbi:2Fe-2S iron-sulfur cluster binding domain-containing protein [Crassaminicella thermophila]|uniref:2Fe-2S iron-sulfur cluster binding domain-containing protein n=1 Tax=Crassaminicella thermophila TaxID=2599308 RepID=A0A5C0SI16_CRATE|nr:NADH-dependent [FeFe] hydrogenase, group A6 [Crassaminicella thermophila]QEK12848.1 2Fe-2S iron-sulfur cluster binding domain-containing protein [Crassaminicella thermophila]
MKYCNVIIDNKEITVPEGTTILEAAKKININIPTLCYHPDLSIKANCRICSVEVKGKNKLVAACSTPIWDGAKIVTNSKLVRDMQKGVLELILANHPQDCLRCIRNGKCELQKLCEIFHISKSNLEDEVDALEVDSSSPSIVRDHRKCIKCNRCLEVCQESILSHAHRSIHYSITPAFERKLMDTLCVFCGQCSSVCPVGAIYEKDDTQKVWDAIHNKDKHVIVQIAPAVRVSIGDEFGMDAGKKVTGKLVAALRRIGFDKVFDTDFAADLTIMEESSELLYRIENGKTLPMITSCSPGWINFIEGNFEHLLKYLSTCKSPQQMFGAISKTYYPKIMNIDPSSIFTVSIMPCTAKKYEATRKEMNSSGFRDIDVVLTTREIARMIKSSCIDFEGIQEEEFDTPLGISTGAGVIFGATGGVMEAALRSVYEIATGMALNNLEFIGVRGLEGIKEASININGNTIKVAVAHGLDNAKKILEMIDKGKCDYTFIEIMCCPGGCIGGGGQPIGTTLEIKDKRIQSIYKVDEEMPIRKSHKNPAVLKLYEDFLGKPLGNLSHKLLHTNYNPKNKDYDFSQIYELN